jgi:alkylhydroperoxidase family enzyme
MFVMKNRPVREGTMPRVHVPDSHADDPSAFVWARYAPEIGAAAGAFSRAVYENSSLSLREMEAARMRTAQINGCKLCIGMRAARDLEGHLARNGGHPEKAVSARGNPVPDEAFYAAVEQWREAPCFSPRERLAIEYAERLGAAPQSMEQDEDFWARLHAHFSDAEIVDMTFSIASWIGFGRLTHALELDGVCMPTARVAE